MNHAELFYNNEKYEDFIPWFDDLWQQHASAEQKVKAFFGSVSIAKKLYQFFEEDRIDLLIQYINGNNDILKQALIDTNEIITLLINNENRIVEASRFFTVNEDGRNLWITHFMRFNGKQVFDEGLGGEVIRRSLISFYDRYKDCSWKLSTIV